MKTERKPMDKSGWPQGPWLEEPDYLTWKDEATGLDCMIVRNQGGALCGYAGVKPRHPLHGKSYNERIPKPASFADRKLDDRTPVIALFCEAGKDDGLVSLELGIDVHGGLTYSAACSGHICHDDEGGEPTWWFGFDCAHAGDFSPAYERMGLGLAGTYRDLDYVKAECAKLAWQLRGFSFPG